MAIATTNPATGEVIKTFEPYGQGEIDQALDKAQQAHVRLRGTSFADRASWMTRAAELLEAEADDVAAMVTTEMGKTLTESKAEALKCAKAMRFYADHAEEFLAPEADVDPADVNASAARVEYQPLGVVLAVMPWNFPLWQAVRFAAPALMAGNTGVLKHASNVPQCALYLSDLFARAGFGEGAFQAVLIGGDAVASIITDDRIAAVTLTGSVGAGSSVAEVAGKSLKKTVLELGGSDAFVVMPSADLETAAEVATKARVQNAGQSCIAAKRFIVHADAFDEFSKHFLAQMEKTVTGDPTDEATTFGPLSSEQGRKDLQDLVEDARAKGATILTGGEVPEGPGWFYPATVITDISPEMRIYGEECFGPVASLFKVDTIDDAIALANDTEFGLSSNAWTTEEQEIDQFTSRLAAGAVFINGMTVSFPELPFGGVKKSGYGRELSQLGIREFCNAKTVWIG